MAKRSNPLSLVGSITFHAIVIGFLFISLEKTIFVPANPSNEPNKEIIDAVMINKEALQKEVARLNEIEQKKREQETERQQELARKEKEAKLKREKEEAILAELKEKNEKLKKEAEVQKKQEQERKEKLKAEQEELKKIKQEKDKALAAKKKAEEVAKKQAEKDQQAAQQNNIKMKQDLITQHAMLLRNKINENWRQPLGMDITGFTCKISVKLMPTGEVVDAQVVQSSGNIEFDRSGELAIRKASPLPMPSDPDVAKEFRQFTFTFHPEAA